MQREVITPPPTGDTLELRIHGAGDTPLEEILGPGEYKLQFGDTSTAGFYRRDDVEDLEAYSWGKFTHKARGRAFWVLLAPFTLANLSGWLVSHGLRDEHAHRTPTVTRLVRTLSLLLSVLAVVWFGALFVDAVALQCGGQEACASNHIWLRPLTWEFFADHPARRLTIGLLGPLLIGAALVLLAGWRNADKYERYQNIDAPHRDTLPDELVEVRQFVEQTAEPGSPVAAPQVPQGYAELDTDEEVSDHPLRDGRLWRTFYPVRALAVLHAAAIGSGIAIAAGFGLWRIRRGTDGGGIEQFFDSAAPEQVFVGFSAVLLAVVGWLVADDRIPDRSGELPPGGVEDSRDQDAYALAATQWRNINTAAFLSALNLIAVVVWGLAAEFEKSTNILASYSGFTFMGALLGALALLAFAALSLALLLFRRRNVAFNGYGPLMTMVLGYLIVLALSSGATQWMSEWLGSTASIPIEAAEVAAVSEELDVVYAICVDEPSAPGCDSELARELVGAYETATDDLRQPPIDVPVGYDLIAVVTLIALLLTAAYFGWLHREVKRKVRDEYCPPAGSHSDLIAVAGRRSEREVDLWRKGIAANTRTSPRNTRMHRLVVPLMATALPIAAVFAVDLLLNSGDWAASIDEQLDGGWSFLLQGGRWIIIAATVGAAGFVRKAYSDPNSRKKLGGVWDVATFWPRAYHPFAPPAYSARAVPELRARIKHWLDQPTLTSAGTPMVDANHNPVKQNKILLSAHSQGVPITMAVITQLEPSELARVGFVSYGSPTGALYGTFFPEFYGPERIAQLADLLTSKGGLIRWRNLWRLTDWTGGYAFPPPRRGLDYENVRCDQGYGFPVDIAADPGGGVGAETTTNGRIVFSEIHRKIDKANVDGDDAVAQKWESILSKAMDVERLLCDPPAVSDVSPLRPLPPSEGHSPYLNDPMYDVVTAEVRSRLDAHQVELTA